MVAGLIDIRQAAERLKLSPERVRQLIVRGQLSGERVGRSWLVSVQDVERRRVGRPHGGQPMSEASAWGLLAIVEGHELDADLPPWRRSRISSYAERPFKAVAPLLRKRSEVIRVYIHPGELGRFEQDRRCVVGGPRAAVSYGAAVSVGGPLEVYVASSNVDALVHDFYASIDLADDNVLIHRVSDELFPFSVSEELVWRSVAALDLHDSGRRDADEAPSIWPGRR